MKLRMDNPTGLGTVIFCLSMVLTSVTFTEQAAIDMIGVARDIQGKLATEKAKVNNEQLKNQMERLQGAGDLSSLVAPSAGAPPIPGIPGAPGAGTTSLLPTSDDPPADSGSTSSGSTESGGEKQDPKAMLVKYQAEFRQLKELIIKLGPKYETLEAGQKAQMDGAIKEAVNQLATLDALSQKYPELMGRKRFAQEKVDISMALPKSGKDFLQNLTPEVNQDFISSVDKAVKAKADAEEKEKEENSESENGDGTDGNPDKEGSDENGDPEAEVALSPEERVKKACSTIIGGKDGGPTLLNHLSGGGCSKALDEFPDFSGRFQIEKIKALLQEWQKYGVRSATLNIGIHALSELGIQVWPGLNQAQVPVLPVEEAVEIQQKQKLVSKTSTEKSGKPSKKKDTSDRPILNSSNLTD